MLSCAERVVHGNTWPPRFATPPASCISAGVGISFDQQTRPLHERSCINLCDHKRATCWPTPSYQPLDSSPPDCPRLSLGPKVPSSENSCQPNSISLDQPSSREKGRKRRKEAEQLLQLSFLPTHSGERGLRGKTATVGRECGSVLTVSRPFFSREFFSPLCE